MTRLVRIALALGLGGASVLLTPNLASAQFYGGYGVGVNTNSGIGPFGLPVAVPNFYYTNRIYANVPNPLGGSPITYSRSYYGPAGYVLYNRNNPTYNSPYNLNTPQFSGYSTYMTGGVRNPVVEAAPGAFGKAQQQAAELRMSPAGARRAIDDSRAYEKAAGALPGAAPGQNPPELLAKALAADEVHVASGEALNQIVTGILTAQTKGGKGDSAFLPPNLLAEVRFTGSPNADAINLLRSAGKIDFPSAFDGPLVSVRADLDRDFAAAAAPVLIGKPADPTKVAKLEATVKKAQDLLTPVIKDLDFEEATAARRLLNQLDAATKVLKTPAAAGLLEPKWATEGTSVADLIKHMTKYKLQFGPAAKGDEDAYMALHRGLIGYLFTLGQNTPQPKK